VASSQGDISLCLVSLGCAKNLVDSERLLGRAILDFGLTVIDDPKKADVVVVNTCAFIEAASQEAVNTILEMKALLKPGAKLLVLGCLVARYREKLETLLPEVDLFLAPDGYENFIPFLFNLLGRKVKSQSGSFESWPRLTSTPFFRDYLKIAEGCNHHCAYCIIPSLRGPLKSRPKKEILGEAQKLVENGALELTLVAQDLTAWSHNGESLLDLVLALEKISGLRWLRLMYAYPERLTEKLVRGLARSKVVVPYLDVPFQHSSPSILKRMGRGSKNPLQLVKRLRSYWPELALRTTLMVGFPGETEADFDLLLNFVEEARFDHLGVFKFSPEEGSRAASFSDQIPKKIREKRRRIILAKQRKISLALNKKRIGAETEILVEGPSEDSSLCFVGRAPFQAPEVDGLVYFDGCQPSSGQLVRARFFKAGPYDLLAKLVFNDLESLD